MKVLISRRVQLELGGTITSDARLLAARKLDEALGLADVHAGHISDGRIGLS